MSLRKRQGHVTVFLRDIANVTVLAVIIHPMEGYIVICPTIFVYCMPGASELKFKHSAMQFGLDQ
jgi:hypothetical protein